MSDEEWAAAKVAVTVAAAREWAVVEWEVEAQVLAELAQELRARPLDVAP